MPVPVCCSGEDLESIWATNQRSVERTLVGLTRNHDLAEDLLQETRIKAILGFQGYRGGDAGAWLGRIARNTFYSYARRRSYNSESSLEDEKCRAGGLEPGSDSHLRVVNLRAAISALPAHLREVLMMKHYSGYTYEEIAARLKCPSGTAKRRVHDAVAHLRIALGRPSALESVCAYADGPLLMDYLYSVTSPETSTDIRLHASECDSCRAELESIRNVMARLDKLKSDHKLVELVELDPRGVPTVYYDASIVNQSERPLELAAFRMNQSSTLEHVTAKGEKANWKHLRNDHFEWKSDRLVRARYLVELPEPIAPGDCLDLLTVSRVHDNRSARQLDDDRFRFRWMQFPAIRWAADRPDCPVAYSQAIRLPKHSRLVKAYPMPAEIRTEQKTTLIWNSLFAEFAPFDCVIEYRVGHDWPGIDG